MVLLGFEIWIVIHKISMSIVVWAYSTLYFVLHSVVFKSVVAIENLGVLNGYKRVLKVS